MDVTTKRFCTPGCTGTYSQLLSLKQIKISTTSWILMKHTDLQKIHLKTLIKKYYNEHYLWKGRGGKMH